MAANGRPRTTKLYGRTHDQITLGEVAKIVICRNRQSLGTPETGNETTDPALGLQPVARRLRTTRFLQGWTSVGSAARLHGGSPDLLGAYRDRTEIPPYTLRGRYPCPGSPRP